MSHRFGASLLAVVVALSLSACGSLVSPSGTGGGTTQIHVSIGSITLTACSASASPLPGWKNCTGTVVVTVNDPSLVKSGYMAVYFNYPDSGAFYHGDVQVRSGVTTYTINVVNEYVSHCVTSEPTTVTVYDGPQSATSAPVIGQVSITLTSTC